MQNHSSMARLGRAGRLPVKRTLLLMAAMVCLDAARVPGAQGPPSPSTSPASAPAPSAAPTAASAGAPRQAAPLPPRARVRIELNQLLQLHHWLMATCGSPQRPEYAPACDVYRGLQQRAAPAVWQFVNDACTLSPDIAGLTARAAKLPAAMSAQEMADTRRLAESLSAVWPVYEKYDLVDLNRSLQRITVLELRQRFQMALEPRVMPIVLEKMLQRPLEAPMTIFPVTHGTHLGDWGKTTKGYYLIQPMVGQPVAESLVHELTHLLESGQPAGERTFLRRLHEASRAIPPGDFDPFAEGLVVYNARRTLDQVAGHEGGRPWPASIAPWVPIYERAWDPYLQGTAGADETVARLVAGFLAQGSSAPPAKP